MQLEFLKEIVNILKENDLHKIHLETENFKLEILNNQYNFQINENIQCESKNNKKMLDQSEKNEKYHTIKSSIVGNFIVSMNEERGNKYSVGDRVKKGQALCSIEAMKMFNEIICDHDGIITEILAKDNQFVEYDQPLFRIKISNT